MNNNSNDSDLKGPIVAIVLFVVGYFLYQLLKSIIAAITSFLFGLVTIALFAAAILVGFFLIRYIIEKQYGDDIRMRKINKLEEKCIRDVCQAPDNMKEPIRQWYQQRQEAVYKTKTEAKFDVFADRTKQVINIFRRDK